MKLQTILLVGTINIFLVGALASCTTTANKTNCTSATQNISTHDIGYEDAVEHFTTPAAAYGVDCWWWWLNGNVTKEAITSDLEAMKEKGFFGAMIFDAGGQDQRGNHDVPAGPQFGSPEWLELFVYALDEAERLGLEIGFNIQSGWNLGGPCITPGHAAKKLTCSQVVLSNPADSDSRTEGKSDKTGGSNITVKLPQPETVQDFYRDIAVLAFQVDSFKVSNEPIHYLPYKLSIHELGGSAPDCRFLLDNKAANPKERLTGTPYIINYDDILNVSDHMDSEGNFTWDNIPDGQWCIMRIGYTCTGAVVSTSSKTWQGLVLDYLSKDALDFYLGKVVDPILGAAGHHVGKTLKFMETDSWECGGMNWSDNFAADFKAMNGYDLLQYLPIIGGYVINDMDCTHAFLADFRKTVGNCVAHNHYARFADYAHARGMGVQPESAGPHAGPFDGVRNYAFSDIVMSEFWVPSPHRPRPENRFFLKQASSAAHLYGKKIVGAESFTSIGPHWNDEIWRSQKSSFDHELCAGLNRVYFHTFTCSPKEMGLPGQEYFAGTHVNPRVTWWNEANGFIDYMTRLQSVVQEAEFNADVLYYYGDHIPVIYPYKHADLAGAMPGFDYDVASEDALLQLKVSSDGMLTAPSGLTYRVLVLPDHKTLSLAALKKVEYLLRKGASVIGEKPLHCISLAGGEKAQKEFARIADKIWSTDVYVTNDAVGDGHGNVQKAVEDGHGCVVQSTKGETRYGKGTLAWGMTAREFLIEHGLMQDFDVRGCDWLTSLDYIHYTLDGRDIYFLCNLTDSTFDADCVFRTSGHAPELWDALTGKIRQLEAYTQSDGSTTVPLHFDPFSSALIVFNRQIEVSVNGSGTSNYSFTEPIMTLEGPWTVAFDSAWGGPSQVVFDSLMDWTASSDEGIRYYSGHALYTKTFRFADSLTAGSGYYLDLGSIKDVGMATVRLNGQDAGLTWVYPFRIDITEMLHQGDNLLEIRVVNSWYNRVAGDRFLPGSHRYTSTNIVLNRNFRGQWTDNVRLSPSGLLGPVKILHKHE